MKILSNNFRAIAFNRNLGYRKKEESPKTSDDDVTNEAYELTEELYKAKAERFRIPFVRMHGDQIHMTLDTPGDASEQNIYSIYCAMPDDKKSRIVMNKLY